jgi:hypothetical protein
MENTKMQGFTDSLIVSVIAFIGLYQVVGGGILVLPLTALFAKALDIMGTPKIKTLPFITVSKKVCYIGPSMCPKK